MSDTERTQDHHLIVVLQCDECGHPRVSCRDVHCALQSRPYAGEDVVPIASPRKDEADPVVAALREKARSVAERNQRIIEAELSGRCGSLPPVHGKEGQR